MKPYRIGDQQRGFSLLEALVAIVIFSLGVLGLIGLQAEAVRFSTDAKFRADAAFLVDSVIGEITVSNPDDWGGMQHQPGGAECGAWSGAKASKAVIKNWLTQVGSVLPNADDAQHQIKIDVDDRTVEVVVCWQTRAGDKETQHSHRVVSVIQN